MTLHGIYFHAWHFLYTQVQLSSWFGNIVAGVVVFLLINVCWHWFLRGLVKKFLHTHITRDIHEKLDAHHQEHIELAQFHHHEHMKALKPVAKKAPATKKAQ